MLSSYHLQCLQNLAHGEEKEGEGDGGDDGGADGKEELPWRVGRVVKNNQRDK